MTKVFYEPKHDKYMYHVAIDFAVLLTYEQQLEREHGYVCTSDPDDNTDYRKLEWRKAGSISFAEEEWNEAVRHTRDTLKRHGGDCFIDGDDGYVYFFRTVIGLKGKHLHRARFWIRHSAIVDFDKVKFNKHLTQVGKTL